MRRSNLVLSWSIQEEQTDGVSDCRHIYGQPGAVTPMSRSWPNCGLRLAGEPCASESGNFTSWRNRKNPNFWSIRVSRDLRDYWRIALEPAYCFATWRITMTLTSGPNGGVWRRIQRTGAAQLVEMRERIQEITVPKYVEVEQPVAMPRVFKLISEEIPVVWRAAGVDSLK